MSIRVLHKSEFYPNGWTNQAGLGTDAFFDLLKQEPFPCNFVQILNLENFAITSQSSVELSWQYLRRSMFYQRPQPVYDTERLILRTAQCPSCSTLHGSICAGVSSHRSIATPVRHKHALYKKLSYRRGTARRCISADTKTTTDGHL